MTPAGWSPARSGPSSADRRDSDMDAALDADVAVVGYGPVGMAAAALMAQAGHSVIVLERYSSVYSLPRAAIFDDETMRTLDKLGLAEGLLPTLHVQRNYEWVNGSGELLLEHSFSPNGKSGWAEWYMMYQPYLERDLDRACRATGRVEVRYDCPVHAVAQDEHGVTVHVGADDGTVSAVRARYVLACDGGNSTVRRFLGVDQDDYGFSEPWMVCDFAFTRADVDVPTARQVGDPAQPVSIISLGPDHHRFSFMLDSEEQFTAERDPAKVWARVSEFLSPDDAELIRVATYTFQSRIAHRWRAGRVLLVGDAAHQMPPFLGQGMCSGIRDAQNLAFKLDLVLRGRGGGDLLDTYQTEREPHVRAVVEKAIELGRIQALRDPVRAAERDARLLAARAANEEPQKMVFPGLIDGLLSPRETLGRGELFVQGDVDAGAGPGRFDEIAGRGTVLLLTRAARAAVDADGGAERLHAAGVIVVTIGGDVACGVSVRDDELVDVEGTYGRWFTEHGACAVAVRPDFYVYGTAVDDATTAALVAEVEADLTAPTEVETWSGADELVRS